VSEWYPQSSHADFNIQTEIMDISNDALRAENQAPIDAVVIIYTHQVGLNMIKTIHWS
jgi:hypothetical protein